MAQTSTSRAALKRPSAISSPLPKPIRTATARSGVSSAACGSAAATACACSARLSSADAVGDDLVAGLLGLGRLVEPALRRLLVGESGRRRGRGAWRADRRQRRALAAAAAGRHRSAARRAGAAAAAGAAAPRVGRTRTLSLLAGSPARGPGSGRRPAAGAGEVELGESEELGPGAGILPVPVASVVAPEPPAIAGRRLLLRLSGTENFDGVIGTSGFSIWPRRSIRRCHWSGLSRASQLRFERVAGFDRRGSRRGRGRSGRPSRSWLRRAGPRARSPGAGASSPAAQDVFDQLVGRASPGPGGR